MNTLGIDNMRWLIFERNESTDGLYVYCTSIVKLTNHETIDIFSHGVDVVLNKIVSRFQVSDLEDLYKMDEDKFNVLKFNPQYEKLLLKYLNLFISYLYQRTEALNLRPQITSQPVLERPTYIYKGFLGKNNFAILELL